MIIDIAFLVIGIIVVLLIVKQYKKKTAGKIKTDDNKQQEKQWLRQPQQQQQEDEQEEEEQKGDIRKTMRKQEKARQKKQRQDALQHQLREMNSKNDKYREQQEEKQRLEEQKRLKQQEHYKKIAEEDRIKKEQQYNKWKEFFVVQNTGTDKKSKQQQQKQRKQFEAKFLQHIKDNKICPLEDISNEFKIPTKKVVQTIKTMQQQKLINGVFDQRGKYIDVNQHEWSAIMSYMKAKGRVSKSDMMLQCANIIKSGENKKGNQDFANLIDNFDEKQQTSG